MHVAGAMNAKCNSRRTKKSKSVVTCAENGSICENANQFPPNMDEYSCYRSVRRIDIQTLAYTDHTRLTERCSLFTRIGHVLIKIEITIASGPNQNSVAFARVIHCLVDGAARLGFSSADRTIDAKIGDKQRVLAVREGLLCDPTD